VAVYFVDAEFCFLVLGTGLVHDVDFLRPFRGVDREYPAGDGPIAYLDHPLVPYVDKLCGWPFLRRSPFIDERLAAVRHRDGHPSPAKLPRIVLRRVVLGGAIGPHKRSSRENKERHRFHEITLSGSCSAMKFRSGGRCSTAAFSPLNYPNYVLSGSGVP